MSDRGRPNGPPPGRGRPPAMPSGPQSWSRPIVWALIAMVVIAFLLSPLLGGKKSNSIRYIPDFINKVNAGQVKSIDVYEDHSTRITGKYNDGKSFTTTGPAKLPDKDLDLFREKGVDTNFHGPGSNILGTVLAWLIPAALFIGLLWWMSRRAQGQMTQAHASALSAESSQHSAREMLESSRAGVAARPFVVSG